jgi:predicted patatin/cPLA2 family phospholipase
VHPVLEAMRERPEAARIALVVEGGGMRGAISGGMVLGLDELGLAGSFDDAYGSSAGTLNAMWLVSGRVREGIPTWTDPTLVAELIDWRRAIGRGPVVGIENLVEQRYEQLAPGLFQAVLASRTTLHPIATEIDSGQAVDLAPTITDEHSLRLALRASATLPLIAGPPVTLDGKRYLDAGLSAAIPFHAAIAGGATHILLLRSRQLGDVTAAPTGLAARVMPRVLRRVSPAIAEGFLTRAVREGADEELLARHDGDPALEPHILSVRPKKGSPIPSRLDRDLDVIRGGLEAGREALHSALAAAA